MSIDKLPSYTVCGAPAPYISGIFESLKQAARGSQIGPEIMAKEYISICIYINGRSLYPCQYNTGSVFKPYPVPSSSFKFRGIHRKLLIWCGRNDQSHMLKASMLNGDLSNLNLIIFIHRYLEDTESSSNFPFSTSLHPSLRFHAAIFRYVMTENDLHPSAHYLCRKKLSTRCLEYQCLEIRTKHESIGFVTTPKSY
jgi:hypothetical protein